MNYFQRYLLDEFEEDYRAGPYEPARFCDEGYRGQWRSGRGDGLVQLGRPVSGRDCRRAVRAAPGPGRREPGHRSRPDDPDISVSDVQFQSADGSSMLGYMAMPSASGVYAGVVVIHENRGLLEHHKDVVRRYAKAGFAALAPDLVSREGGTDNADPDQVPGMLATADPQRHSDDSIGAGAFLQQQDGVRSDAHGMTGFCFGGGVVWRTIGQDQTILAAVPYYGPNPPLDLIAHTRAASFGMYGELDTQISCNCSVGHGGARRRPACRTTITSIPAPTTPSSTTPVRATTKRRRPTPGRARWPGSASICRRRRSS